MRADRPSGLPYSKKNKNKNAFSAHTVLLKHPHASERTPAADLPKNLIRVYRPVMLTPWYTTTTTKTTTTTTYGIGHLSSRPRDTLHDTTTCYVVNDLNETTARRRNLDMIIIASFASVFRPDRNDRRRDIIKSFYLTTICFRSHSFVALVRVEDTAARASSHRSVTDLSTLKQQPVIALISSYSWSRVYRQDVCRVSGRSAGDRRVYDTLVHTIFVF